MRSAVGLGFFFAGFVALSLVTQGCADDAPPASADPDAGNASSSSGGTSSSSSGGTGDGDAGVDPDAEPTGPPAVRYVGRTDTRDPAGPKIALPGVRVIVRFEGTGVTAKINETNVYRGPSGYDVIVDGKVQDKPFIPQEGENDHVIAEGLAPGKHVVELYRRTEATVGVTQLLSIDITGGKLLAPPNPAPHKIEFIGDSAATGYGIECASASEDFSGATQNERKSFPALIARGLGADHSNFSISGKGVSRNYDLDDADVMELLYPRALPDDPESTWSFASWVPDLVFVAMGGNDYAGDQGQPPPNKAQFKAKYHDLLTLVRAKYPNAILLVTVASVLSDEYPVGFDAYTNVTTTLKAIVDERKAAPYNDAKVHYHELVRSDGTGSNGEPDLTGCNYHLNAAFSEKVANDAIAKIKTITGW